MKNKKERKILMDMKKLILILAVALLSLGAHQESYRLENIKVKKLRQNHKDRDGLLTIDDTYGITDPNITSIEDVVNSYTVTDWDSRYDKKDYVGLKKTFDKGSTVLDYTVRVYRPWNSPPSRIEAMGATDQGQYLELSYFILEKRKKEENVSPFISTTDSKGNPMLIDRMTKEHIESKKSNPTQQSLNDMLSKIDRIRVVDAGMSGDKLVFVNDNNSGNAKVFFDTNSKEQIESFRSYFTIVEDPKTFGHCMCVGWPTFEFLSGTKLVARISLHHGRSIRWPEWKYDGVLSRNKDVLNWLAANGAPQPKESYEADLARAQESRKQYEQWLMAVPGSIRTQVRELLGRGDYIFASEDDINAIYATFSSTASPESQALSLFKWYGSGCGLWSGYPSYEEMPNKLLMHIPTGILLKALTSDLSDAHIEGAARFFTSREFNNRRYPDRKMLPEDLKKRIREYIMRQTDRQKIGQMETYLPK